MQPQRLRCQATAIDHGGRCAHLRGAQTVGDALALPLADVSGDGTSGRRVTP
jgi:hypothetical protein